jgi:hypothetical protein
MLPVVQEISKFIAAKINAYRLKRYTTKYDLGKAYLRLKDICRGNYNKREGLCLNMGAYTRLVMSFSVEWEHYSGSWTYPVPKFIGDTDFDNACFAYTTARHSGTLWDKTTEYGALRHELAEFLMLRVAVEISGILGFDITEIDKDVQI